MMHGIGEGLSMLPRRSARPRHPDLSRTDPPDTALVLAAPSSKTVLAKDTSCGSSASPPATAFDQAEGRTRAAWAGPAAVQLLTEASYGLNRTLKLHQFLLIDSLCCR